MECSFPPTNNATPLTAERLTSANRNCFQNTEYWSKSAFQLLENATAVRRHYRPPIIHRRARHNCKMHFCGGFHIITKLKSRDLPLAEPNM